MLREIGGAFELEKVDSATKRTETGVDYLAVNPLGYAPALTLDDGQVLLEAPAILQYLADGAPGADLAPAAGTLERVRLQQQLNFIASELYKSFGPFFAPIKPEGAAREQALTKLDRRFDALEVRLGDGRPYLMGEGFTVADAYAFVVASWAPLIELDLDRWPRVQAYVARIGERRSVQEARRAEGLAHCPLQSWRGPRRASSALRWRRPMTDQFSAVEAQLQIYFDGLYHSDVDRLRQVFHPQARYVCATDDTLVDLGMDAYLPIVSARPSPASRGEPRRDRVVSIEFAGPKTARARVNCAIGERRFTDFLTLIDTGGAWRIISKVFHYDLASDDAA